jgi:hypothetical protein
MNSRPAPTWQVFIDGQLSPAFQPLRIVSSIGVQADDYCDFQYNLHLAGHPRSSAGLRDFTMAQHLNLREVAVVQINGTGDRIVRHRGRLMEFMPGVASAQGFHIRSRADQSWFGRPVTDAIHFSPYGKPVAIAGALHFNPLDEHGRLEPNMATNRSALAIRHNDGFAMFLDPRTIYRAVGDPAGSRDTIARAAWALGEAAFMIAKRGLRSDTLIGLNEIVATTAFGVNLVRDLVIPYGTPAALALDKLLTSQGYSFRVIHTSPTSSVLAMDKVGRPAGDFIRPVFLQRGGDRYDPLQTNLKGDDVVFSRARLVNAVAAIGQKRRAEITVELQRGWPAEQDDLPHSELSLTGPASEAYRLWSLNEAGAFNAVRPGNMIFDVGALFGGPGTEPHIRRRFLPTLTLDAVDGLPFGRFGGIVVEYSNPDFGMTSEEPEWLPADFGWMLSKEDCTIYITEQTPAFFERFVNQREGARIRVTATIESVHPIQAAAPRRGSSFAPFDMPLALDLSQNYAAETFNAPDPFKSKFYPDHARPTPESPYTQRARNEEVELAAQVVAIRDSLDHVEISGRLVLEGLDRGYMLGMGISEIRGRGISLLASAAGHIPQVVRSDVDVRRQTETLTIGRLVV